MTVALDDVFDAQFPNLRRDVVDAWRNAPDHLRVEILEGDAFAMPRPRTTHGNAAGELLGELRGPFRLGRGGPGGWIFLPEPELHLGKRPDIVDPDLAGWRRERMPVIPQTPAITLAPDWICEILSDGTEAHDRGRKMRAYRRAGVGHYWLVDPRIRTLEVYRLEGGRYALLDTWEGDVAVRAEPFDAVELDLALLWAR